MTWKNRIIRTGKEDPRKLTPNPQNWRKHPKKQAMGLAGALEEVGWVQDVLVNERTGRLVDGHLRVELAIQNKEKTVPVKYVDLTEEEEALVLATLDPITGMAEADKDRLAALLSQIQTENQDVQSLIESIGKEFKIPLSQDEGAEPQIDRAAELMKEWGTETGQLWNLGPHRVLCGDSTRKEDMDRLMQGEKADLVFTDPPYGVNYTGKTKDALKILNDTDTKVFGLAWGIVNETCKPGAAQYVCCPPGNRLKDFNLAFETESFLSQILIWVKNALVLGHGDYHYQHEPILYGWNKNGKHHFYGDRKQTSVWMIDRPSASREHPTMKPIDLVVKAIKNSSRESEIILDPFLSSGTTLIACENLGRICRGMEIAPEYVAVTLQRYKDTFGKDPELAA